jgi:drug/metabolite transporter (DMT)-like permease
MPILTAVAILVRIIANPLANVFQKQLTQRTADPLFITTATYGFLTLACLAFWPQIRVSGLSGAFWFSMLACAGLAVVGNVFLVKAMHLGDLSVLGPINAWKAVVSMLVAVVLLGEIPGWAGLAGVVLIVAGSYVVLKTKPISTEIGLPTPRNRLGVLARPDVRLRLIALVCSGIDGVFLKKAILLSTPFTAFFGWCGLGFILSGVWVAASLRGQWRTQTQLLLQQWPLVLGVFISVGLMQVATNYAFSGTQVGYALALFQTSALLSVLFGYRFFGETDIRRKLIGAAIMVAGAALIVLA